MSHRKESHPDTRGEPEGLVSDSWKGREIYLDEEKCQQLILCDICNWKVRVGTLQVFPGGISEKEPAYQCRRQEKQFQPLGQEDPLGECMATQPQYSCLGNSMGRGARRTTVHRVAQSTQR